MTGARNLPRVSADPAARAAGRAIGVFFLSGFGACWLWLGIVNAGRAGPLTGGAVAAGTILFIVYARKLRAAAGRRVTAPSDKVFGRAFLAINMIQWLVIVISCVWLNAIRHVEYAPAAVATIVGLHFLPLAWLLRSPIQYVTGAALLLDAAVFRADFVAIMLAAGLILCATALFQLVTAYRDLGLIMPPPARQS